MSNTASEEYFRIGDSVTVTEGFFKGQVGTICNFDFQYGAIGVLFREHSAIAYLNPGAIQHVPKATAKEAEVVKALPGENPEKLDDEGGQWDTKVVVLEGPHKGMEGELIGPNKKLTQTVGAEMIDIRLDNGNLRSVRLENVDFRPIEVSSSEETEDV